MNTRMVGLGLLLLFALADLSLDFLLVAILEDESGLVVVIDLRPLGSLLYQRVVALLPP